MKKITEQSYYPWLLVLSYSLLGMTFPAAVTQYSMVVNELAALLGCGTKPLLLADTVRAVALVIAMFLSGPFYQKLGLKKTIFLGLLFQISSQLLLPTAIRLHSVPLIFLFKGMQGLNSIAFPLYISTITLWIPSESKGLATSIFNGSFIAGGGIGAWLSGILLTYFGAEYSFYAVGCLCLIFGIPALLLTKDREIQNADSSAAVPVTDAAGERAVKKSSYQDILKKPITWILVTALIANTWVSQAVNVDMSVYAQDMGFDYGKTGTLMLMISVVTVLSSVLAGGVSDWFAAKSSDPLRCRSLIMTAGYALSFVGAALLPMTSSSFPATAIAAASMMFGASWAAGVFWAIPSMLFSQKENVSVTSFCSSASNVPNPIAPAVVGVLLGGNGLWSLGWMSCAVVSLISMGASILIPVFQTKTEHLSVSDINCTFFSFSGKMDRKGKEFRHE